MDLGALRAGHLDLPIVEDVPAGGLVCSQIVGFYNLDPAGAGGNVFGIGLNDRHDIHELENQIARDSVRSETINRADQHGDLCHDARIIKKDKLYQSGVPKTDRIRLFAPHRFPQAACYVTDHDATRGVSPCDIRCFRLPHVAVNPDAGPCVRAVPCLPGNRGRSSVEEAAQLLAVDFTNRPARTRDRSLPLRDRAILELLYASGIRNSELIRAAVQHLDLESRTLRVIGKGQKERIVVIGRPARAALENYLNHERGRRFLVSTSPSDKDKQAIFLSWYGRMLSKERVWQLMKEAGSIAGIEKAVYPYLLRHKFATHLLAHGADLRVIQELLGHADITTTAIYTHVDHIQLKKVYKRCHPRATIGAQRGETTFDQ
jgi:site-specific recombinase XerC